MGTVVLDKIGIITQDKPTVIDLVTVNGTVNNNELKLLRQAAFVEGTLEHSLAEAVVQYAKKE